MVSYAPLWNTMKKKNITQYQLIMEHGIDRRMLDALRKNKNITTFSMERLCTALECEPNDIVEFTKE